jgi:hypothetical protein
MNISHWISAILSALALGACVHFAVHVAMVNDRSWPKPERLVWGVQRQQADVRSWGLPTAAVVDPSPTWASAAVYCWRQLRADGADGHHQPTDETSRRCLFCIVSSLSSPSCGSRTIAMSV